MSEDRIARDTYSTSERTAIFLRERSTAHYVVQANDTPGGIARRVRVKLADLYEANPDLDPKDDRNLKIGFQIKIPLNRGRLR